MNKNIFKWFPLNMHCRLTTFVPHISLCGLSRNIVSLSCGRFSSCGAIGRLLINKVTLCSCMIIWLFKIKCSIINSKITVLCGCNRSAVLTYIYMCTHASSSIGACSDMTDTRLIACTTRSCPRLIACTTHTYPRLIACTTHT